MNGMILCHVLNNCRFLRSRLDNVRSHFCKCKTLRNCSTTSTMSPLSWSISPEEPPTSPPPPHTPVMVEEVVKFLGLSGKRTVLDMTFGAGGHSKALLEANPELRVVCLDRDPSALDPHAAELRDRYQGRVLPLLGRFSDLPKLLTQLDVGGNSFDGVLMDLGVSSMQFDTPERGFMLSKDGPLDMRMDGNRESGQITAGDVVAHCDETTLYKVLKYYGEEKHARAIARALVEARYLFRCPRSTRELAAFVEEITGTEFRMDKLQRFSHPATKTFQALRILVNNELNELDYGMQLAFYYLRSGGRLVTISFHSLEDTIIKRHIMGKEVDSSPATLGLGVAQHRTSLSLYTRQEMQQLTGSRWSSLLPHVLLPSPSEVLHNPRSRSAKLRVVCKQQQQQS